VDGELLPEELFAAAEWLVGQARRRRDERFSLVLRELPD
jgi:hypothetical protein